MAKKKRKSSKRNPEITERNKRIAIGAAIVIGGASAFVGTAMGVSELDERSAAVIASGDPVVEIVFPLNDAGESWMPIDEREWLNDAVKRAVIGTKALSVQPLELVGQQIIKSGWANGQPDVRWTADGRIVVTVDWRQPAAVVRVGPREIVIDWDAHVLRLEYPTGKSNQFYFVNASGSKPKVGRVWQGDDLRDGLALYRLLFEYGLLGQVEGIDLGEGAENGTLSIRTNRGAKIVWGGGPGHTRPGEQPTSIKADRLKALLEKTGRIDGNVELLDVRGDDITLMRGEG